MKQKKSLRPLQETSTGVKLSIKILLAGKVRLPVGFQKPKPDHEKPETVKKIRNLKLLIKSKKNFNISSKKKVLVSIIK